MKTRHRISLVYGQPDESAQQITSDSVILDHCVSWINLIQECLKRQEKTARRMEAFLQDILRIGIPVLLIAPPALNRGAWVQDEIRIDESRILSGLYKELTIKLGADFADAGEWAVELSFDGVHFTEAGHKAFAQGLKKHLEEKLYER